ncbi:MAG TPA: flagellar hook-length control protein FliK, partial [Aminivibrio sp.]|nr:flagellar hook-length control protein FliK [Aminivibrio sp.]
VPEGQEKNGGAGNQENRLLPSASRKDDLSAGISGNGDGEKGEGRQSMSGKNDGTGAALFSQRPAQGTEGVRTERFPVPGGFARELALAGRNGEALEDGMHNVVRFMRTEGHHRASMIVDPPALGRVEIELASTSGGVEASIRVGNEQLRQLVQDQITVLRTHLQQQGVQVAELTVDIRDSGREGHGEARDGAKDRNARVSGMAGTAEEDIPSFAVDLEKGLLHWVA